LELVEELERKRLAHYTAAETLSRTGINADVFESLARNVNEWHLQVLRFYRRTPFSDLPQALDLLQSCIRNLQAQRELTQLRVQARDFCRSAARLVAEAISQPLPPPEGLPTAAPVAAEPEEEEEEEEPALVLTAEEKAYEARAARYFVSPAIRGGWNVITQSGRSLSHHDTEREAIQAYNKLVGPRP
jgi:hypothetical protein